MFTKDWSYIEDRLLSPTPRLMEAVERLRKINRDREAEQLMNAARELQDVCRAVRNDLRTKQDLERGLR